MEFSKEKKKRLSRRDFIKTTAVGVGATAFSGLSATAARAAGLPEKWDKEADVVVAGCGGAGATAAITAFDDGAGVLILEKAPEGGGNTRIGSGQFCYTIPEKKDDAAVYMHAACNGTTPMDVCRAWANGLVHHCGWLDEMGVDYTSSGDKTTGGDFRGFPGAGSIGHGVMKGYGLAWYRAVEKQIEKRGIELWPGGFSTMGGPKKNVRGQVLDVEGNPIGRLYAAGSPGHTLGQLYSISGANNGEVFVWGRISGRNAAALKSWT